MWIISQQSHLQKKRSVIPALWEAEVSGSLEVRSLRPACSTWWTLPLLPVSIENTKNEPGVVVCTCNPSYSEGWGRRIALTWEAEVAVSRDRITALQPEQQSKVLPPKRKTNPKKQNKRTKVSPFAFFFPLNWLKHPEQVMKEKGTN